MSVLLAINVVAFFAVTIAGASVFGIAIDKGVTWYHGNVADTDL